MHVAFHPFCHFLKLLLLLFLCMRLESAVISMSLLRRVRRLKNLPAMQISSVLEKTLYSLVAAHDFQFSKGASQRILTNGVRGVLIS